MRVLVVLLAAAVVALPAAATGIDPKVFVLQQKDVPAGFRLDRDESGVRSNAREAKNDPRLPSLIRRWGRLTGYETEYDRGQATIGSRADLFRSREGARMLLDWFDLEVRKAGMKGLKRSSAPVGTAGWVYAGSSPVAFTLVAWRYDRVFAGVVGMGVTRDRTLELARAQQRRIAIALD